MTTTDTPNAEQDVEAKVDAAMPKLSGFRNSYTESDVRAALRREILKRHAAGGGEPVAAWVQAYHDMREATEAYNVRLAAIRKREASFPSEFGRDNPHAEYRLMEDAKSKALSLLPALYAALSIAPAVQQAAAPPAAQEAPASDMDYGGAMVDIGPAPSEVRDEQDDPLHPQFIAGFKAGHVAGRARGRVDADRKARSAAPAAPVVVAHAVAYRYGDVTVGEPHVIFDPAFVERLNKTPNLSVPLWSAPEAAAREGVEATAQPVSIADPDYARAFSQARCIAWGYGYALLLHGTATRDLDLLAVPWTEQAIRPEELAKQVERVTGLSLRRKSSAKPHGRHTFTLYFPDADPRWVDLSVMPLRTAPAQPATGVVAITDAWTDGIRWPKERRVGRQGEMAPTGKQQLEVLLQEDGDVIVAVSGEQFGDDFASVSAEFCSVGSGGGKSPRTRLALIALMCAIEDDNSESPSRAWPQPRQAAEPAQHQERQA